MYAIRVRGSALLALCAACSFTHGGRLADGGVADAVDAPPDGPIVPTWTVDSTSGKGVPASTTDWSKLIVAYNLNVSAPDHVWLMQEASGSLTDSMGSVALAPVHNPTYSNTVSGWTRLAVGTPPLNANEGFATTAIGNLNGTSYAMLLYVAINSPPTMDGELGGVGAGTDYRYVAITTTPSYKATGLGGVTPTTGAINPGSAVHPILLVVDESHQSYVVYTDAEQLSVAWTGTGGAGGLVAVGCEAFSAADARYLYGALWSGSHAELATADVKKLLTGLGWSVTGW